MLSLSRCSSSKPKDWIIRSRLPARRFVVELRKLTETDRSRPVRLLRAYPHGLFWRFFRILKIKKYKKQVKSVLSLPWFVHDLGFGLSREAFAIFVHMGF